MADFHAAERAWFLHCDWQSSIFLFVTEAALVGGSMALGIDLMNLPDEIFNASFQSTALKLLMTQTRGRKDGLLQVLKHPILPLHNNDCERDIREYAKRRKISGSTRSEIGRKARDTFVSLKKTCQKHSISFWNFVLDRLVGGQSIPRLATLIEKAAQAP